MMRHFSWVTLRQVQAVRESVEFTLRGSALALKINLSETAQVDWLKSQGLEPFYYNHMPEAVTRLSVSGTMRHAVEQYGVDMLRVEEAGAYSRFDNPDIGTIRSSAGWNNLPNFITSSALIRVLGAMEQYELDVLKALLYYRPAGTQNLHNLEFVEAELSVATEVSNADGRYSKPALWSWLKKSAENSVERRKIYKNVFGLDCFPAKFGTLRPSEIKNYIRKYMNSEMHLLTDVRLST
jgi:hypothetical protein